MKLISRSFLPTLAFFLFFVVNCATFVYSIDFGLHGKAVSSLASGVYDAGKASAGAIASIPGKIIPATGTSSNESQNAPVATTLASTQLLEEMSETEMTIMSMSTEKVDKVDKSDTLANNNNAEKIEEGATTMMTTAIETSSNNNSSGGSWYQKPLDTLTYVPNKVIEATGDAISTVSETVVSLDPAYNVKFYYYDDPKNLTNYKQIVPGQEDSLRSIRIPKDTRVNLLIHGFMQDFNSSFPQNMKDTLLLHTGTPVICVDWGHMADGKFGPEVARTLMYPFIVDNVARVGEYVGDFVVFMKNNSAISSLDQVHILGFSLGAHVSGIAGWTVQNRTEGEKIARITGLDPAGPKFFLKSTERRLNTDDAKFVDVIHTSHLGYFLQMGHVDFFPNGGKIQPGCIETESGITDTVVSLGSLLTGSCSHARAWEYYLKSIKDNEIVGCECNNIFKYEVTGCEVECDDKVPFGEQTPSTARGNYFLSI